VFAFPNKLIILTPARNVMKFFLLLILLSHLVLSAINLPDVENQDLCSICLERLDEQHLQIMPCRHRFHIPCIRNWLMVREVCPNCREIVPLQRRTPTSCLTSFLTSHHCEIYTVLILTFLTYILKDIILPIVNSKYNKYH